MPERTRNLTITEAGAAKLKKLADRAASNEATSTDRKRLARMVLMLLAQ